MTCGKAMGEAFSHDKARHLSGTVYNGPRFYWPMTLLDAKRTGEARTRIHRAVQERTVGRGREGRRERGRRVIDGVVGVYMRS